MAASVPSNQIISGGKDQMDVRIKQFDVKMNVKSKGIEFEVRRPGSGNQIGDCYVTMKGLTWCKGRTTKHNGVEISWKDLATMLASKDAKNAALKAATGV